MRLTLIAAAFLAGSAAAQTTLPPGQGDPRLTTPPAAGAPMQLAPPTPSVFARSRLRRGGSPLNVGFYVSWDPAARASLAAHIDRLDVLSPQWVSLAPGGLFAVTEDPEAAALFSARTARGKRTPAIMPLVNNAHDRMWDPVAADQAMLDAGARAKLLSDLAGLARSRGWAGYVFDFENISPAAAKAYPAFLTEARRSLPGLEVWATANLGLDDWPAADMARSADALVLMAYDECWTGSNPGPIAGPDWIGSLMARRAPGVKGRRLVVALADWAYDWPAGQPAKTLAASDALALATSRAVTPTRDTVSGNLHFDYVDAAGVSHSVWIVDAAAWSADAGAALKVRPRGLALWRLGLEDPALWTATPSRPFSLLGATPPHPCDPLPAHG